MTSKSTRSRGAARVREEEVAEPVEVDAGQEPEDGDQDPGTCVNCGRPADYRTDGVEADPVDYCDGCLPPNLLAEHLGHAAPADVGIPPIRAERG